jgi:hypothetical protein
MPAGSAMKHQNTVTTNRLKTLVQTKKPRPSQTSVAEPSAAPALRKRT